MQLLAHAENSCNRLFVTMLVKRATGVLILESLQYTDDADNLHFAHAGTCSNIVYDHLFALKVVDLREEVDDRMRLYKYTCYLYFKAFTVLLLYLYYDLCQLDNKYYLSLPSINAAKSSDRYAK